MQKAMQLRQVDTQAAKLMMRRPVKMLCMLNVLSGVIKVSFGIL